MCVKCIIQISKTQNGHLLLIVVLMMMISSPSLSTIIHNNDNDHQMCFSNNNKRIFILISFCMPEFNEFKNFFCFFSYGTKERNKLFPSIFCICKFFIIRILEILQKIAVVKVNYLNFFSIQQHYRPTNDSNKHSFILEGEKNLISVRENMFFFRSFFLYHYCRSLMKESFWKTILSKKQQETCKVFASTTTKIANFVFENQKCLMTFQTPCLSVCMLLV